MSSTNDPTSTSKISSETPDDSSTVKSPSTDVLSAEVIVESTPNGNEEDIHAQQSPPEEDSQIDVEDIGTPTLVERIHAFIATVRNAVQPWFGSSTPKIEYPSICFGQNQTTVSLTFEGVGICLKRPTLVSKMAVIQNLLLIPFTVALMLTFVGTIVDLSQFGLPAFGILFVLEIMLLSLGIGLSQALLSKTLFHESLSQLLFPFYASTIQLRISTQQPTVLHILTWRSFKKIQVFKPPSIQQAKHISVVAEQNIHVPNLVVSNCKQIKVVSNIPLPKPFTVNYDELQRLRTQHTKELS